MRGRVASVEPEKMNKIGQTCQLAYQHLRKFCVLSHRIALCSGTVPGESHPSSTRVLTRSGALELTSRFRQLKTPYDSSRGSLRNIYSLFCARICLFFSLISPTHYCCKAKRKYPRPPEL